MNTLIDRKGHLNIHLKIFCKRHILLSEALRNAIINLSFNLVLQKGSTATKRVYEPGLNDTDQEVQSRRSKKRYNISCRFCKPRSRYLQALSLSAFCLLNHGFPPEHHFRDRDREGGARACYYFISSF